MKKFLVVIALICVVITGCGSKSDHTVITGNTMQSLDYSQTETQIEGSLSDTEIPAEQEPSSPFSGGGDYARADDENSSDSDGETASPVVTMSIVCGEDAILNSEKVGLQENDSVFSLLVRITKEKKIHLDFSGSGESAYVKGINNIYAFDEGPESGWIYRVNGSSPSKGCGAYELEAGDVVEWRYSTNMTADIGAIVE